MRFRDLELRQVDKDEAKWELVQWNGGHCFVIAFLDVDWKEGHCDMRTIGMRYFDVPAYTARFAELSMRFLTGLAPLLEDVKP